MSSKIKALEDMRNAVKTIAADCDEEWILGCLDAIESEITERFIELPLDADDVPIRVGDVMEGVDKYDTLRNVRGEVIEISFNATDSEGLVASVALQVWSADGKSWHRYIDPDASVYRHVKPRTLEDVLEDFGIECDEQYPTESRKEIITKYADEIRELLRGDAE